MKITRSQLKKIIKEEMEKVLREFTAPEKAKSWGGEKAGTSPVCADLEKQYNDANEYFDAASFDDPGKGVAADHSNRALRSAKEKGCPWAEEAP